MDIEYKENPSFKLDQLIDLYTDAGWISYTARPEDLHKAVKNSLFTLGAFSDGDLIGLIRVVGDDVSIIYIQDILVKKSCQRLGIGSVLLQTVLSKYKDVRQIVLMTDETEKTKSFYEKNGMVTLDRYDGVGFVKYNM